MTTQSPILPVYAPAEQVFVRGEGAYLFTDKGERYLDFIAGIAVNALGHAHPKLVAALTEQAGKLWHVSNMFKIPGQAQLAEKYIATSFAETVFFTNSGTEAIEGALKMARKYHSANGQPERIDIIGFHGAFHGRTYAAINAAGNPSYLEGFGPALPGYLHAPFGDLDAVKKLMSSNTAAIIIEPVQGEGGARTAPEGFLKALRDLCDQSGALLIYDEVQSGAGRTGKLWAHEWDGVTPDIMAAAKGIGGGFPLGALMATREASKGMVVGTHGTTYGGNPLAMAVGNAAFDEISHADFLERVRVVSSQLDQSLEGLRDRHPETIVELRGRGLLRGVKLSIDNKRTQAKLREKKILVGVGGENIIRLAPPLIVDEGQISEVVNGIDGVLASAMAEAGS